MKTKFLIIILTVALALGVLPTSVFCAEAANEKGYELPGYQTSIKVSNVVSDNSDDYITIMKIEMDGGEIRELSIAHDLYIEAAAPCKVTYSLGDQYIHYAKKLDDGSFTSDYGRDINLDVNKRLLFTLDNSTGERIMGATVDEAPDESGMDTGADGNYVTLGEGIYIVSNYDPSFRHAEGQSFADYDVILSVKGSGPLSATAAPNNSHVLVNKTAKTFEAYTINGNNYFKLRDLAMVLNGTNKQFEVAWDSSKNAINLVSNKKYTVAGGELKMGASLKTQNAVLSTAKLFIDDKETALTAYTINGNNYFKLRDFAKAFNIGVTWDELTSTIGIDTSISYTE